MVEQINPPFDGSAPCPMCSSEIRGCSAYVHNMLNRWREGTDLPEPKFWHKLDDLKLSASGEPGYVDPARATRRLETVQTSHPDVRAHLDAILELVREYAKHQRPENHEQAAVVFAAIRPIVERLRITKPPADLLSEAHFDDNRHASGMENILREQKGYSPDRGGQYHWTVREQFGGPVDLTHNVCGTGLVLHEHFKERLARDKAFYARVYCPKCGGNMPIGQFRFG